MDEVLEELAALAPLLRELVETTRSATALVEVEAQELKDQHEELKARHNRLSRRVGIAILALAVLTFVVAAVGWGLNRGQIKAATTPCVERVQTREDIREAIGAAVDEVAVYADAIEVDRTDLTERVAKRVASELPPPRCAR